MQKKGIVLSYMLFCCATLSFAQQSKIKGEVINDKKEKLLGNILLLAAKDSSLIKGGLFLEGTFEVDGVNATEMLLKIVSTGYRDTIISIKPNEKDLGFIVLKNSSSELKEMVVSATALVFETPGNGDIKVNVRNTMLSTSASVHELLSKSPNVITDENGISVLGKGQALIYLNGKRINENQLSAIQVRQIKNVEIISSPSAKYDSNGKAVIDIITFKNPNEGLLGEVVQNTTYAKHLLSYTSVKLNWRKQKWSSSMSYGQNIGTNWETNQMKRQVSTALGGFSSFNDFEDNSKTKYVSDYLFGIGYDIDSKSSLTIEYLGATNITNQNSTATTLFYNELDNRTTINATTSGTLKNNSNAANLNYNKTLDTLGSSLFIGAQYYLFNSNNRSLIDEFVESNTFSTNNSRMNTTRTNIAFVTAQADVEKFLKKGGKFEYGIKYTRAGNSGTVDFFSKLKSAAEYAYYPALSNDFKYDEDIPAAYLQFAKNINLKTSYVIGVRSEYTNAKGVSKRTNKTVIDKSYINVFPNLSMNYKINKKLVFNLAFTSTINRPSYQAMDPFLFYVDSLTASQGNPGLKPEYAYTGEMNLSYKKYSFKLGYTLALDPSRYAFITGNNGPNSSLLTQFNIQQQNTYYGSVTVPVVYKSFQSYNIFGVTWDQIVDTRPEFQTTGVVPRLYCYTNNSLSIKNVGRLELNGRYLGTRFDGIYYRKPAYNVSSGISRMFLKNKLKCTFLVDDIFRSNIVDGYYNVENTKVSYVRTFNTHFYRLSLSYKFGKLKDTNYKSINVGNDSGNRIKR